MKAGLFDIQVNGFAGVDFQQPGLSGAELRRVVRALADHETVRFFATLITDAPDALAKKLEHFERLRAADGAVGAAVCGYHLEGPWISPEPGYRGAHEGRYVTAPDPGVFERLQRAAGGNIRLVTLAPELPGSLSFIRALVGGGVQVSLGHTQAADAQIDAAIEAGARFCTHLGNAVPVELPRHDNVMQRLLARDELTAFFIPDGIHLPPRVLQNFFRAKPPGKALFITDAMAAAGAPPGRYTLGGLELEVGDDRIVRQPGRPNFAGSALCADQGVQNVQHWLGLSAAAARPLFSTAVADLFQIKLPSLSNSHENQVIPS